MVDVSFELRKFVSPEFIIGVDARKLAGRYAKNLGASHVFLVTGNNLIRAGWVRDVIESLDSEGIRHTLFADITPNPRDFEVMNGAKLYKEAGCDAVVALGGGSPLDCAKGIGIVASNDQHILEFEGVDNVIIPAPPLICIPTTAGSAADVSQFAIITDTARKVKIAIISKKIVPDISLIDPVPLTSLTAELTAHTGMDALVHSIEAYVSNASSPVTDIQALESIRLISAYLPLAYHNPDNIGYRYKTMLGSLLAGLAFSNASLGAVHAMAHSLGGLSDLPHGECNALLLESVIDFNFEVCPQRYETIAGAMNIDCQSHQESQIKQMLLHALQKLRVELGITERLGDLGVTRENLSDLAKSAMKDPCLATNPRKPTLSDLEKIYEKAL
ncbi:alcohol dehydrogenase-like regulatory protein ErcA [Methanospirillum stamsii]|uniref:Alcohol dehydrogenase n=1 Tax=Methanospirillum stamsii TaxID=1277351 RepID=A0A2V2NHR4_9EURY|nr:alcohol dehydrogenase-like regulatory protein ErcA [Methanospirillum stamsii]PWR75918.1 alcohol dehydrogenase [Methanospirillum stamsii]